MERWHFVILNAFRHFARILGWELTEFPSFLLSSPTMHFSFGPAEENVKWFFSSTGIFECGQSRSHPCQQFDHNVYDPPGMILGMQDDKKTRVYSFPVSGEGPAWRTIYFRNLGCSTGITVGVKLFKQYQIFYVPSINLHSLGI